MPDIKLYLDLIESVASYTAEKIDDRLIDIDRFKEHFIAELNNQVAIRAAIEKGLKPVASLDRIKKEMNEKIIHEVKSKRLKHREVAEMLQIHRSRITAIMNRHLERVSLDLLVQMLNILGIDPELKV